MLTCICLGIQRESSSARKRNACEAYAEEAFREGEKKAIRGVWHCIGFKAQEGTTSEQFMERK